MCLVVAVAAEEHRLGSEGTRHTVLVVVLEGILVVAAEVEFVEDHPAIDFEVVAVVAGPAVELPVDGDMEEYSVDEVDILEGRRCTVGAGIPVVAAVAAMGTVVRTGWELAEPRIVPTTSILACSYRRHRRPQTRRSNPTLLVQ